jgi:hypothetical protein
MELQSEAALAAAEAIRLLGEAHMDKRLTGVLAAAATVATVGAAQALPQANSYAELLVSVPNSTDVLKADDQARAEGQARVQLVQFHHHHHHHHHRVFIRHHHHHHHHVIVIRRHRHHHHHHHYGY